MAKTKTILYKVNHDERQKVMSQMKGQDKTPEKQQNEVEIGNIPEKRIQNNDSEDDSGSWKNNREDARKVYQRLRKTKEQTEMNNIL